MQQIRPWLTCIFDIYCIEEVLGFRDILSKFQQVEVVNRKTETNRNAESPKFDEEREDDEIRENVRIMSISSRPIFSVHFHVQTFHVSVSLPHV